MPTPLLRQADQAMYAAKQAGQNRYHLFDPEKDRRARGRHESLDRIRRSAGQQRVPSALPAQGEHAQRPW